MSSEKPLTKKDYLQCFAISVLIAITYTVWLIVVIDWIEESKFFPIDYPFDFFILHTANTLQITSFLGLNLVLVTRQKLWNDGKVTRNE